MKKKLAIFIVAAIFSSYIPAPVYADATDDQIAKIEKQIAILQAQLDKLKRKKGEQDGSTNTDNEWTSSGNIFSIKLLNAYCKESVETKYKTYYPDEGNVFLIVDLEAECISDQSAFLNLICYESYVDDYYVDNNWDIIDRPAYGDVRAGKKLVGSIGYEVPEDWKEFELGYSELSSSGEHEITFTITHDSSIFQ